MFIRLDKTEIKSLSSVSLLDAKSAQVLIIDGISIFDLEKKLLRFSNLKTLVIKNIKISSLNFVESKNLEFINLEKISLDNFEQIVLPPKLTGLSLINTIILNKELDLSSYSKLEILRIKNVEASIHFNGKNLTTIFLLGCKLKAIPSFIFRQINLRRLFLNFNQISRIDQELNTLINLEILALSDNYIEDAKSTITLKKLKNVALNKNNLSVIPSWIYNQEKLEQLSIGDTNINNIPDKLFNLKNIKRLNFSNLNIDYFSNKVQELKNFYFVNLDGASVACDDILYDFLLESYGYSLFEQRTP